MTREDILRMAEECGARFEPHFGMARYVGNETFVQFAALVAAAEREKCAKFFDDHWREGWTDEQVSEEIRAMEN